MTNIANILTEHMAIWTAADTEKNSGRGRASGNVGNVYGVKKLRELILELAVRGKLVRQDPNDEPASELLKRIQAEKAKLIAKGKLKKEKTLAPIGDDEKTFELPFGWEWARVSNLAEIKGGKRLPEGKAFSSVKTSNIYIQVTNMKYGTVIEESIKYIDDETKEILKKYAISSEDLYITIAGTIGDVGTVPENFNGMILTENAAKIVFNFLDKNWFKYCFSSNFLGEQFQEKTIQLAQAKLALHRVASSVIALPPLDEQHRIVAKVDELMALCDQLEQQHSNSQEAHKTLVTQLLATLTQSQNAAEFNANWQRIYANFDVLFTTEASIEALKQTLLQLAVMGKLVQQDPNDESASELLKRIQIEKAKLIAEGKLKKGKTLAPISSKEKPFELPKGWIWHRLGELFDFKYGDNLPESKRTNTGEYPVFGSNGIVGTHNECFVNSECIVIGRKGSAGALNLSTHKGCCVTDVAYYCVPPTDIDLIFAFKLFHTLGFDELGKGIKPGLSRNEVYELIVPIPPLAEQRRIVSKISELEEFSNQLKDKFKQNNQQKKIIADALILKKLNKKERANEVN